MGATPQEVASTFAVMAAAMLAEACGGTAKARRLAARWTRKITARETRAVIARNASTASLVAAFVPPPRQLAARLGVLPGDGAATGDRRRAAAHRGVPGHPEDDPPVPEAVRRRFRGQRPGHGRPGRLRRSVAGAGDRARVVTAPEPRHRTPALPVPALADWRYRAACRGADLDVFFPGRGESVEPARRICVGVPGPTAVPGLCAQPRDHTRDLGRPDRPGPALAARSPHRRRPAGR
jgi:hypothetical protein